MGRDSDVVVFRMASDWHKSDQGLADLWRLPQRRITISSVSHYANDVLKMSQEKSFAASRLQ